MGSLTSLRLPFTLPPQGRILLILLVGLVHGLLYYTLMPPWQHYDEPGHFEFAALIAREKALPKASNYDQGLRREIAASMVEHGFFEGMGFTPNLISTKPVWIGSPQLKDPPAYYLAIAALLSAVQSADVEVQLYLARFFSLLLYLGTIYVGYRLTCELTEENHPLRWMLPLAMALLPAFNDIMTAVNNDVGAVFVFSLYLWAGTRLLRRGPTPLRALGVILTALLSFVTKNTVFLALPFTVVLLVFTLARLPGRWTWVALASGLLLLVVTGGLVLSSSDAAAWYRGEFAKPLDNPTRRESPLAPFGAHALEIRLLPDKYQSLTLLQPLPPDQVSELRGQRFTLGAWVWADEPVEIFAPALWVDRETFGERITVGRTPAFITVSGKIKSKAERVQITLSPLLEPPENEVSVYYDGLLLVAGNHPDSEPQFTDENLREGVWGGEKFTNLVRNPSAERNWITFRPTIIRPIKKFSSFLPKYALNSLQDLPLTGGLYSFTLKNLFKSFWATFGWNHIQIPSVWYRILAVLSGLGLAGMIWGGVKRFREHPLPWKTAVLWLGLACGLVWFATLTRLGLPIWGVQVFVPVARYAYPVVVPTMLAFTSGWFVILQRLPWRRWVFCLPYILLFALDVVSLMSVWGHYG